MSRILMITLVTFLLLTNCSDAPFFHEFYTIPSEEWKITNIPEFQINVAEKQRTYRLILQVRNTTDYAYSNIFFFLNIAYPGREQRRDTIECMLADRYGNWLGKGIGRIKESSFLIKQSLVLPDTGTYVIALEQAMRDETLKGITDIGIRIEYAKTTP